MADIGVLGLGVMGRNLSLNLADHGYATAVFNRHAEVTDRFLAECRQREPAWHRLQGFHELEAFVSAIARPRRIVLLIKAGRPTDLTIENLLPFLDPGDILIDCGNAHWLDTIRRERELRRRESRSGVTSPPRSIPPPATPSKGRSQANPSVAANPAPPGWGRTVPAITSRWSTTASNTSTCS